MLMRVVPAAAIAASIAIVHSPAAKADSDVGSIAGFALRDVVRNEKTVACPTHIRTSGREIVLALLLAQEPDPEPTPTPPDPEPTPTPPDPEPTPTPPDPEGILTFTAAL